MTDQVAKIASLLILGAKFGLKGFHILIAKTQMLQFRQIEGPLFAFSYLLLPKN